MGENEQWSRVADAEYCEYCDALREEEEKTPKEKLANAWANALFEHKVRRETEARQAACRHEVVGLSCMSYRKDEGTKVSLHCHHCGAFIRGDYSLFQRYRSIQKTTTDRYELREGR